MFKRKTVSIALRERTRTITRGDRHKEKVSKSFLEWTLLSLVLAAICSVADYVNLLGVLDEMLNLGVNLNRIVTLTIAVVENTLPLLVVYLWLKHRYQPNRHSIFPVVLMLLVLGALFAFLMYMRWLAAPFTFDMVGVSEQDRPARELANRATTLVLGFMPVATSIASGVLYYIADSVYDLRHKALRERIFELKQQQGELQAVLGVIQDRERLKSFLQEQNEQAYAAAVQETEADLAVAKEYEVLILARQLHCPDLLSRHAESR